MESVRKRAIIIYMKRKLERFAGCLLAVIDMLVLGVATSTVALAEEISESKKTAIMEKCDSIKASLVTLQHNDSRARVYLGRQYETIISNYIKPLNVSLVENNLSTTAFINNQNNYVAARQNFVIDFIEYQKGLEELVAMDCKARPNEFYDKLVIVRAKRKIVADDEARLMKLSNEQIELATGLMEKL